MKKKLPLLITISLLCNNVFAQNYIKVINQDIIQTTEIVIDTATVSYSLGISTKPITGITYVNNSQKDIVWTILDKKNVEYIETQDGHLIYSKQHRNKNITPLEVSPKIKAKELMQAGNNVYVPMPDEQTDVTARLGNALLRDYIRQQGKWNLVDNEEEAHFIVEYIFNSRGRDSAKLGFWNRYNKAIVPVQGVIATDSDARNAATKSVPKLLRLFRMQ